MQLYAVSFPKGRRHLAFIVDHYTPSNQLKVDGFKNGVTQFCSNAEPIVIESGMRIPDIYAATQRLMREYPDTDGIIFSEDLLAVVGLRALIEMGIDVPAGVGIIGINNSQYTELCTPTLTSLDNMLYDLSLTAARNLIEVLNGQRINKRMMIYSEIVERQST